MATEAAVEPIGVEQLARSIENGDPLSILDANSPRTREQIGIIPGATLLTHYRDCIDELPTSRDQPLVFYCYDRRCTASKYAAQVAVSAGYRRVHVLPEGVLGWRDAGQPLSRID
ncbi:MAG: rhodanese-like domain-containing protein [Myxococcota bacterium]